MNDLALNGRSILVIEDEYLIGTMLADAIEDAGGRATGPVVSVAAALDAVAKGGFDAAVVDWNLQGEPGSAIGMALVAAGTPFVISTGYGNIEPTFASVPVLTKPYQPHVLIDELARIIAAGPSSASDT